MIEQDGTLSIGGAFSEHLTDVLKRVVYVVGSDGAIYEVDVSDIPIAEYADGTWHTIDPLAPIHADPSFLAIL